jgi:nucleotide-binding universal stress UspA family protein
MYQHILIPTDGSELSQNALDHGVAMAQALKAKVTVLTVSPFLTPGFESDMVAGMRDAYETEVAASAKKHLDAAGKAAAAAGVSCEAMHVVNKHPYQAIIDTAKLKGCDLIVMASHGRRGISAVVLGSETVKVLTHSGTPVLVVRPASSAAPSGRGTKAA